MLATEPLVEGNTEFALKLFARIGDTETNIIVSPYSISCALAMMHAGARGLTAQQLESTAAFPQPATNLPGLFHALDFRLDRARRTGKAELAIANAVWTQAGYNCRRDFLELITTHYQATAKSADFVYQPENVRSEINQWVDENTRHKIRGLFAPGIIDTMTRVVVVNSIYFRGTWAAVFSESATKPGEFFVNSNRTVTVPMMTQSGEFKYFGNTNLQCLVLPYRKQQFEMIVLLPRAGGRRNPSAENVPGNANFTLAELERELVADNLDGWLRAAEKIEMRATIPRFRIANRYSLKDVLAAMGIKDAFEPDHADFSGMTTATNQLFLTAVVHQAVIDVNEKGTEAAAATGEAAAGGASAQPEPFVADHPFVFLVRETGTGTILFMGQLMEPGSGEVNVE